MKKTKVIFRMDGDEVLAVFPEGTERPGMLGCYAHVGQHSLCSYEWCRSKTKSASPSQYEGLKKEIEKIGYVLQIQKRM